jgi:hypothetical protein
MRGCIMERRKSCALNKCIQYSKDYYSRIELLLLLLLLCKFQVQLNRPLLLFVNFSGQIGLFRAVSLFQTVTSYLWKMNFAIIVSSSRPSSKWLPSKMFPYKHWVLGISSPIRTRPELPALYIKPYQGRCDRCLAAGLHWQMGRKYIFYLPRFLCQLCYD